MKKVMNHAFPMYWKKLKVLLLIMRLISFLILVGTLTISASSYSQQTKLDLQIENSFVDEILLSIENSSKFIFIYDADIINSLGKKSIEVKGQQIDEVLTRLFSETNVGFKVDDRQVFLFEKDEEKPFKGKNTSEQTKNDVTGNVTDSAGQPLPGVSIIIKGTTNGTITDFDGNFNLSSVPGDATLVFSFVGMKSQEIPVDNQATLNVIMEEDAIGIEEVVAVGYGTRKKISVTGAIAAVKNEDLLKVPVANTSNALAGRLPGLLSSQVSGEPGIDYASINIRGFGNPLIIVDGVEASLNNVSPSEIENITILKDASAAIYGSRAGNGVVLVTTKRGTVGKSTIKMDAAFS